MCPDHFLFLSQLVLESGKASFQLVDPPHKLLLLKLEVLLGQSGPEQILLELAEVRVLFSKPIFKPDLAAL